METYRAKDITRITGVDRYHQHTWLRTFRIVAPSMRKSGGMGSFNAYSKADLNRFILIRDLFGIGLNSQAVIGIMEYLDDEYSRGVRLTTYTAKSGGVEMTVDVSDIYHE
jgi:hypothetical protein